MREENCQFRLFVKGTVVPDLARGLWDFSFTKGPNEPTQAHLSMVSVPRFYISPNQKVLVSGRPTDSLFPKIENFFFLMYACACVYLHAIVSSCRGESNFKMKGILGRH